MDCKSQSSGLEAIYGRLYLKLKKNSDCVVSCTAIIVLMILPELKTMRVLFYTGGMASL